MKWDWFAINIGAIFVISVSIMVAAFIHAQLHPTFYPIVKEYKHNGHNYIVFRFEEKRSIVHDPDCGCQNNR